MRYDALILIIGLLCIICCFALFNEELSSVQDRHEIEINRLTDSLAKCNGIIKNHLCYGDKN